MLRRISHPQFETDPHLGDAGLRLRGAKADVIFNHAPLPAPTFKIPYVEPENDEIEPDEYREIADIVRDLDLFKFMSVQEVEAICRQMQIRDYKAGKIIMREGDNHNGFYIILDGELRVTMQTGFGRPVQELACLEVGDIVGEMSHILDEPCNATVKSKTESRLLYFSNKLFEAVLAHNAFFKDNVERIAFERRAENAKLLQETDITQPIWSEWFKNHPSTQHQELDPAAFARGVEECEFDATAMRAFGNLTRKLKLFGDISIYELEEITNRISLLRIP